MPLAAGGEWAVGLRAERAVARGRAQESRQLTCLTKRRGVWLWILNILGELDGREEGLERGLDPPGSEKPSASLLQGPHGGAYLLRQPLIHSPWNSLTHPDC